MVNKFLNILILLFLIIIHFGGLIPLSYESGVFGFLLLLDFVALISFGLKKEKYKAIAPQKLKFSTLFLLGFLIVHFQGYLDLFLGFLDVNFQLFWIDKKNIIKSLLYCSIALNAFFVGYSLCKTKPPNMTSAPQETYSIKPLKIINLILFVLFLTLIDATFLDSTLYGDREMRLFLGYAILFYETSFVALTVHIIRNAVIENENLTLKKYIQQFGYSFYIFLIYLLCILFSGDRGPIIYLTLMVTFGYIFTAGIKISTIKFYAASFGLAVLVSLLGVIRRYSMNTSILDALLATDYYNRYYPNSFLPFTKELAGSVRTVHIAVNSVPERYDYFYGLFTFQNFSLVVPGLSSFLNVNLGIDLKYLTSAQFLTFLDLGGDSTWGIGTSAVADVYLDFGVLGLLLVFLLFGYFSRRIEVNVLAFSSVKVITLTLYVLYFGFSIYISRSNLFTPLVKFPYVLGFFYLIVLMNRKKR